MSLQHKAGPWRAQSEPRGEWRAHVADARCPPSRGPTPHRPPNQSCPAMLRRRGRQALPGGGGGDDEELDVEAVAWRGGGAGDEDKLAPKPG